MLKGRQDKAYKILSLSLRLHHFVPKVTINARKKSNNVTIPKTNFCSFHFIKIAK